ncbi:MAG: hypothetical protein KAU48_11010 [Candidatus Thorarchaeota archaeon]|nr:hypothetical protein [Candidatus Thorarchaeota archaeon]
MKKGEFTVGVAMLVIGIYSLWLMFTMDFRNNLLLWISAIAIGMIFVSIGPTVMVVAYSSSDKRSFKRITKKKQWQVIQLPLECSECGNTISIRSLEWTSEEEVRCPFCSKDLDIRISMISK